MYCDAYDEGKGGDGCSDDERPDEATAPDLQKESADKSRERKPYVLPAATRGRFTLDELTNLKRTDNDLVRPCDIRGILHSHSNYTDGAHSITEMAQIAGEIGLEYLGISDHFQSPMRRNGLDLEAVCYQRGEVDKVQIAMPDLEVFQGVEIDVGPDGVLPLDDETLKVFDYVIVSFPDLETLSPDERTVLVEKVAGHPRVTILGLPVGDWILNGDVLMDMGRILRAAAAGRTAVEVNANPTAPALNWRHCLQAQEMGVRMVISPNAHRAARLVDYRHGAEQANGAGLCCGSFLNTLSSQQFREYLAGNDTSD